MANTDVLTAGKIAESLGVPPGQVKKAIDSLKLKPVAKKGACSYYDAAAVAKIKTAVKK